MRRVAASWPERSVVNGRTGVKALSHSQCRGLRRNCERRVEEVQEKTWIGVARCGGLEIYDGRLGRKGGALCGGPKDESFTATDEGRRKAKGGRARRTAAEAGIAWFWNEGKQSLLGEASGRGWTKKA